MLKEIAGQLKTCNDRKAYYMPQNYEQELELEKTPVESLTLTGEKEEQVRIFTFLGSLPIDPGRITSNQLSFIDSFPQQITSKKVKKE